MPYHRALAVRWIRDYATGQVSKPLLAAGLLPLSALSFFGMLVAAAAFFPAQYDWRVSVISRLTSPLENPRGYWLASVGVTGAMLLALPVAGYLARRLHAISPRFGRVAGPAFAFGFALLVVATAVQHILPVAGSWRLHPVLAGSSVGCFILGMCCCCAGALGDYLRSIGGRRLLSGALTCLWVLLPLVPAACLAGLGALMLLGQGAGLLWAEDYRQSFRHTMMWQLAFWEWIGAVLAFAFLLGSAALLPASCGRSNEIETESGGVALPNLRPERGSRSGRAGSRTWTTES